VSRRRRGREPWLENERTLAVAKMANGLVQRSSEQVEADPFPSQREARRAWDAYTALSSAERRLLPPVAAKAIKATARLAEVGVLQEVHRDLEPGRPDDAPEAVKAGLLREAYGRLSVLRFVDPEMEEKRADAVEGLRAFFEQCGEADGRPVPDVMAVLDGAVAVRARRAAEDS
jgi:hypothetical protein